MKFLSISFIINSPLLLFVITSSLITEHFVWLLIIPIVIFLESMLIAESTKKNSLKKLESVNSWFNPFFNKKNDHIKWNLREVKQDELFKNINKNKFLEVTSHINGQNLSKIAQRKRKENNLSTVESYIRVFVIDGGPNNKVPNSIRTYASFFDVTYIFLNDYPRNLTDMQRFLILHEIAHATPTNIIVDSRKNIIWKRLLLMILIIVFSINKIWLIIPLIIISIPYGFYVKHKSKMLAEIHADMWALGGINSIKTKRKLINNLLSIWSLYLAKKPTDLQTMLKEKDEGQAKKMLEKKLSYLTYEYRYNALTKHLSSPFFEKNAEHSAFPTIMINYSYYLLFASILICACYSTVNVIYSSIIIFIYSLFSNSEQLRKILKRTKEVDALINDYLQSQNRNEDKT